MQDKLSLFDNSKGEIEVDDLRFFSVHKSNIENALTDEGFDGYIGLFPDIDDLTGLQKELFPTLVSLLYK